MSGYEPRVGDHVEVVLRGEVTETYYESTGRFQIGSGTLDPNVPEFVSVEKVEPPKPPLPTTPGSVIRSTLSGAHALLLRRGRWINGAGYEWAPGNDGEAWEMIYDAGAES